MTPKSGALIVWFDDKFNTRKAFVISAQTFFTGENMCHEIFVVEGVHMSSWFLWEKDHRKTWRTYDP